MKFKTLTAIVLAIACCGVQRVDAQTVKDNVYILGDGAKLYPTSTYFWYADTIYVKYHYNDETKFVPVDVNTETITITKDMGLQAIQSLSMRDKVWAGVFKPDKDGKAVALSDDEVEAIKNLAIMPSTFVDGDGFNYISADANIDAAKSDAISRGKLFKSSGKLYYEDSTIGGGKYTWNTTYYDESRKVSGCVTVSTPSLVYLSEPGMSVICIDQFSKGKLYNVLPIIRSGYPYDKKKYNGNASWTITDEKGEVIKSGTVDLKAADENKEYVDTIAYLNEFVTVGEKVNFTVTFPNKETETYSVGTKEHEHSFEYSFTYDDTSHWFKANCSYTPECADVKLSLDKHGYDDADTTSVYHYVCSVCHYINAKRRTETFNAINLHVNDMMSKCEKVVNEIPEDLIERKTLQDKLTEMKSALETPSDTLKLAMAYGALKEARKSAKSAYVNKLYKEFYDKAKEEMTEDQVSSFKDEENDIESDYMADKLDKPLREVFEDAYKKVLDPNSIGSACTASAPKSGKYLEHNNIVIIREGKKYNATGARLR